MTRKDFVRSCAAVCAGRLCGSAALAQTAGENPQLCDPKELADTRNRADAAGYRFSKLITILEAHSSEADRKEMLHCLGAACLATWRASLIDRYKGNLKGLLEEGRRT